jgi:predicted nucleotidyltransferase component of viral defense system
MEPGRNLEIVVEANVTERSPHLPVIKIPFAFPFQDSVVSTEVSGYDIHEMLGTKLRALFQRRRGRDLFDLYWALTLTKPAVNPAQIIESFQHYLKLEGSTAGRSEFVALLNAHLADRGFCSDMNHLLRVGITYDPQRAGDYVRTKLLSLLPAP